MYVFHVALPDGKLFLKINDYSWCYNIYGSRQKNIIFWGTRLIFFSGTFGWKVTNTIDNDIFHTNIAHLAKQNT